MLTVAACVCTRQEENTYTLGTTSTVEDFWRLYVHLRRPVDERPTVCDYHVFREGIRPMWEDEEYWHRYWHGRRH